MDPEDFGQTSISNSAPAASALSLNQIDDSASTSVQKSTSSSDASPETSTFEQATTNINNLNDAILSTDAGIDSSPGSEDKPTEISQETAENLAMMDPENPLMKRVQDALYKQLVAANERLESQLREKEEAVKKAKERREEVGVDLYNLQQRLAKLQRTLEGSHTSHNTIKSFREKAEANLKETTAKYNLASEKLNVQRTAYESRKSELETTSRTLKQIELFHEELKSKLALTRRTIQKAEEDLIKQELEKKRQDYYIDQLTEQVKRLQERKLTYEAQLLSQQKETKLAHEALQEAAMEMDAITFERRQLLHQWKSSLVGMQRRQEILSKVEKAIQKEKDSLLVKNNEIHGFKLLLRKVQDQNENLTAVLSKVESEIEFLNRQMESIEQNREGMTEKYSMYTKTLQQTEAELSSANHERQSIVNQINNLQKQTTTVVQQIQKIEKEISDELQTQLSIDKGASGIKRDVRTLREVIAEKEAIIAQTQNELAGMKVEALHVSSRTRHLKGTLQSLDKDLHEKNAIIEKYEIEIRRRNDELSKKQSEIDLLNKKYNQLASQFLDETTGPLEATINNLTKTVNAKEKECSELQRFWLKTQNDLVIMTKKSQELSDIIQDLKMRQTVLSRKRMSVNAQFEREEKEIRQHQRNIRALQKDMVKVNTLLSKQAATQAILQENNLGLEHEYRCRLKDAELESVRLEQMVETLKEEKDKALADLIEVEHQILLWDKKIQLAKETQAALDPNVGAQEIREMTSEIHRMELRYSALQKLQEKLIAEMERSITRRETIGNRSKVKSKGLNQAALNKAIADLNKRLKAAMQDLRDCDHDIDVLVDSQERLNLQLRETADACQSLAKKQQELVFTIEHKLSEKAKIFTEINFYQKKAKRYLSIKEGKYQQTIKDTNLHQEEIQRQSEKFKKVEGIVDILGKSAEAHVRESLESVKSIVATTHAILAV